MYKTTRLALGLVLLAASSFASVLTITNPASLGATDSVDWGQLGPDLTIVPGPLTVSSLLANSIDVSNGTNDFWALQEGNSWAGNFNPGDNLLYNQAGGPITLVFLSPVAGLGAHFQSGTYGVFTVFITAFDSANTNLGTVTTSGTSNGLEDGSAAFLGLLSSSADIKSVVVNVQLGNVDNTFSLGSLSIAEQVGVPEPSTMFLMLGGLLAGVSRYRRQRK